MISKLLGGYNFTLMKFNNDVSQTRQNVWICVVFLLLLLFFKILWLLYYFVFLIY